MRPYLVKCSNTSATYTAGTYVAESAQDAMEMAREAYRVSPVGRRFQDTGAFRFWISTDGAAE